MLECSKKSKCVRYFFSGSSFMESDQACEQCADGAHWRHDNPCMGPTLSQIGPVQRHKVTDVVCDKHTSLGRGFLQDHRVCGALPLEVIDAAGINTSLP